MDILGMKFAPLKIPLQSRLQTLAAVVVPLYMTMGPIFFILVILYFVFFTRFWLLPIVYIIWILVFDNDVCERGGRRVEYIRSFRIWKYYKEYFHIHFKKESDEVELDPKRNYLFCCFPYGLLAIGVFTFFGTRIGGFHKVFPKHTPHLLTLKQNFSLPLYRDFLLAVAFSAVSAKNINYLMSSPKGGNAAVLVVGGAAESLYSKPGKYHLVLKNRKGFTKLALKNGCPLVPTFAFGETDIFDQVSNPEGSHFRSIQERIKKITGYAPVIPLGRGFFQYSFGFVPLRKPINIVVGKPINIEKTETPTQEQIDT